jgi:NADH:ubiquinone reductase (non-electrogenic)
MSLSKSVRHCRSFASAAGSAPVATPASSWRFPTFAGMKDLASEYGKPTAVLSGLFGSVAYVNPVVSVSVASMLAAAHVADLAVNNDLDDLTGLPRSTWNRMCGPAPNRKRVVVLGSGWGALSMVRKLDPMVYDVVIVSPRTYFFYTPLLAGVTTGTVKAHSVLEPVRQTTPMPHATFMKAECTDINVENKTLGLQDAETKIEVPYDHLVIAVGTQPNTFGIAGVQENALFLKELNHGTEVRKKLLERLEQASIAQKAGNNEDVDRLLTVAVVGGGPTGVEFCAELADFISTDIKRSFPNVAHKMKVHLVEALPGLLSMFDPKIGEHVTKHLVSVGVDVKTETMVKGVDGTTITLGKKSGSTSTLDYGMLVWVAGVGARPITKTLAAAFGQANPRGIEVDEFMRVKGAVSNEVFAFGDCSVSGNAWTAQVAAQQGKYLARAFRDEGANPSKPFVYDHQGTMAYVGKGEAVAVLEAPDLSSRSVRNFSFFRNLASCPDAWLNSEHRKGQPVEVVETKIDKKTTISLVGQSGFAVWRGVYYAKLFSYSNRYNVAIDWIRNVFWGRPTAYVLQSK